ncbi:MAG: Hydroxymethylbilane hydrolyase (cyclizing) [Ramlibacter sp.]|jgi:uroporphyrinogen-III synthase|nr:Hydroxymethylbilane hydrolyase (cyclizing) [Ramlibacter sp.]
MAVVVTRPAQEAQRWAVLLREGGLQPVVLPLLAIAPAPDREGLRQVAAQADDYAAVMFVSAHAVQGFFAASPRFMRARAWAPGPATRDALLAAGVPPARIDAPAADAVQFDSESLWQQVQGQLGAGDRLLVVRGADATGRGQGREWLAQQVEAAGAGVAFAAAYRREPPAWSDAERALARGAAVDGSWWLFSSSEAARNLPTLLPGQDWSRARAVATHPRIVQSVRALGFRTVVPCRPALADVVASIESAR